MEDKDASIVNVFYQLRNSTREAICRALVGQEKSSSPQLLGPNEPI